jgi:hypothetical protein
MIRNDSNFDIIFMRNKKIDDIQKFITDTYACDTVPWRHLVSKTKYLLKSANEAFFILTRNRNPDEAIKGKESFRHLQSNTVVKLKEIIRNKFNPKFEDENKRIPPLDIGVSHEHVIHASDYESQVNHMIKTFGFPGLSYYKRYDKWEYKVPFHLNIKDYRIDFINIEDIRINVIDKGLLKIEETPHYKFYIGEKQEYIDYFQKHFTKQLSEDHFPEAIESLFENYQDEYVDFYGQKGIVILKDEGDFYRVMDGGHRVVIEKIRKKQKIKAMILKSNYSNLLDLMKFFKDNPNNYCILKIPDYFPNYHHFEDLDILCDNKEQMKSYILKIGETYKKKRFKIKINERSDYRTHIDFYAPRKKKLNFKFDLIDSLKMYKNINVEKKFAESVLKEKIRYKGVFVPKTSHDLAIRYLEYFEYKDSRPDKVKHLHYVKNKQDESYKSILRKFTDLDI